MKLEPLDLKWKSFGWEVEEINGHDMGEIVDVFEKSRGERIVVIAHTIKGKGVSFLENNNAYHAKPCCREDCRKAIDELSKKYELM